MNVSDKEFQTGTGLGGLIAAIVVIAEKLAAKPNPRPSSSQDHQKNNYYGEEEKKSDLPTEAPVRTEFKLEREDGRLTVMTVIGIYKLIVEKTKEDYASLIKNSRKKRRDATTTEDYLAEMTQFNSQLQVLMDKKENEVLSTYSLSEEELESSAQFHLSQGNQELTNVISSLPTILSVAAFKPQRILDLETVKTVLQEEAHYLAENSAQLTKHFQDLGGEILQAKIQDFVFEKFGFEEEEITNFMKSSPECLSDPGLLKAMQNLQTAVMAIQKPFSNYGETKKIVESDFKVERIDGRLSVKTLIGLYGIIEERLKAENVKLMKNFRKTRRESTTEVEYIAALKQLYSQLEERFEKAQLELLAAYSISKNDFDSSIAYYVNQGNQELFMVIATQSERLNESIESQKSLDLETLNKIMQELAAYLTANKDQLKTMAMDCPEDLRPMFIQYKLGDFNFKNSGVEDEDIGNFMKTTTEWAQNVETQKVLQKYEVALMALNQAIGLQ